MPGPQDALDGMDPGDPQAIEQIVIRPRVGQDLDFQVETSRSSLILKMKFKMVFNGRGVWVSTAKISGWRPSDRRLSTTTAHDAYKSS